MNNVFTVTLQKKNEDIEAYERGLIMGLTSVLKQQIADCQNNKVTDTGGKVYFNRRDKMIIKAAEQWKVDYKDLVNFYNDGLDAMYGRDDGPNNLRTRRNDDFIEAFELKVIFFAGQYLEENDIDKYKIYKTDK